jgi:hypothetical protein
MLRDALIDWGAFLELNGEIFDYDFVIRKVTDLLDIRKIDNIKTVFIDLLRVIFKRDAKQHLQCMIKQYFIYEQRSIAIFKLFTLVKHHYEFLVVKFVNARNSYIESKGYSDDYVDSIKGKKTNYWFYLPAYNNFPESLVDFQTISYVSRLDLEQYKNSRILSLSALGRHNLGWALSVYFSRPVDTE